MIVVEKKKDKISILGHALYEDYGKDIVCSAVSSIVITTINGILIINKDAIKVNTNKGIEIDLLKSDKVTLSLIENMMLLLKDLEKQYPKNIKIKEGV
ncbi:MAG: ribosomal-processing cysteine protease Prp [Bacilli bacterium]|nr:ribosomal-processing cysteine protease Prp [Bacilli bacterium]